MAVKLSSSFPVGFFLKVADNMRNKLTDNVIAEAFPGTSIKQHDLGLSIYFTDCRDIPGYKTYVDNFGDRYALYTSLTVHNVFVTIGEKQLRSSLEQTYGKVLQITSEVGKHSHIRNWCIILDVPEIPDSLPFTTNGYPNSMSLRVLDSLNESCHHFNVTFHCRKCQKDGHIDKDCRNPNNTTNTSNYIIKTKRQMASSKSTSRAATSSSIQISTDDSVSNHVNLIMTKKDKNASSTSGQCFKFTSQQTKVRSPRKSVTEKTLSSFLHESGRSSREMADPSVSSLIQNKNDVKMEISNMLKASNSGSNAKPTLSTPSKAIDLGSNEGGLLPKTVPHANTINLRSNDHNQIKDTIKSEFQTRSTLIPETKDLESEDPANISTKIKQAGKARKRIIDKDDKKESFPSTKKYNPSFQTFNLNDPHKEISSEIALHYENSEQDFNFAYSSTRQAPATSIFPSFGSPEASYSEFPSANVSDMGESSRSDVITGNKDCTPSNPEEKIIKKEDDDQLTVVEKYLDETRGVLTKKELKAFLVQSKKKSNLNPLLHQYKISADSLLQQLSDISELYYKNPDQGVKSDKIFMKKLEGLSIKLDRIKVQ